MKLTKRKGFNFFRSYYDVYNELENDSDKVAFIEALLDRQFLGVKPEGLKGMAKFAYISQTNSIDSQVQGYNDRQISLKRPTLGSFATPPQGLNNHPPQGGIEPPPQQVQGKVQGKEKVQDVDKNIFYSFDKLSITVEDHKKLLENYTEDQIQTIYDSIQNHKNNKNYKSLYLTALNWLKRDNKNNGGEKLPLLALASDYQANNFEQIKIIKKILDFDSDIVFGDILYAFVIESNGKGIQTKTKTEFSEDFYKWATSKWFDIDSKIQIAKSAYLTKQNNDRESNL